MSLNRSFTTHSLRTVDMRRGEIAFKCRIPFLNGGLFEPLAGYDWQKNRNLHLPNRLFTNTEL